MLSLGGRQVSAPSQERFQPCQSCPGTCRASEPSRLPPLTTGTRAEQTVNYYYKSWELQSIECSLPAVEQMGVKLLEVSGAGGFALGEAPCPQAFSWGGPVRSGMCWAGLSCTLGTSPLCRPGGAGCSHESHCCSLKGKSIATPQLLSRGSCIKHMRKGPPQELLVARLCCTLCCSCEPRGCPARFPAPGQVPWAALGTRPPCRPL